MAIGDIAEIIGRSANTLWEWASKTERGLNIRFTNKTMPLINQETENKIQIVEENSERPSTTARLADCFGISAISVEKILVKKGRIFGPFDESILYSEEERIMRIQFCNMMLANRGKLIYRTFFSDEMPYTIHAKKTENWQLPNGGIAKKSSQEDIVLNCWGAISAQGATSLEIYEESLDGELYQEIIERHTPEMKKLYPDGEFYFFQDHHAAHDKIEPWIRLTQKFNLLLRPKRSPDLSIIEYLFAGLKEKLASDAPNNIKELKDRLTSNWDILTKPERLQPFFQGLFIIHRVYKKF